MARTKSVKGRASAREGGGIVVKVDDSTNVIESLIFTRGQSYSDTYRFRFMIQLVKVAQEFIYNNFDHLLNGEEVAGGNFRYAELVFPLRSVLAGDSDKNYAQAKRSLLRFSDWVLVTETDESFSMTPILSFAEMRRRDATLRVEVRRNVWDKLLDFSKGYSEYNPEIILKITSPFGRQMYKGLRNQKGVVSYTVDNLRNLFGYKDKYVGRDSEFVARVVEKAKQELDSVADYSFVYEVVYGKEDSGPGRKGIEMVNFRSVRRLGNEGVDSARKMVHPAQIVGSDAYRVLTQKLFFTFAEVKANVKLFELVVNRVGQPGLAQWLDAIVPHACRAKTSTQGYVVSSLKRYLLNKFGVRYGKVSVVDGDVPEASVVEAVGEGPSEAFRESVSSLLLSGEGRGGAKGGGMDNVHGIGEFVGNLFGGME